ncbi:MAG: hypothetical protein O9972_00930 [Burkholderiales bacterium]|nr:hypothetical protein [Burkholderiales bacterium]
MARRPLGLGRLQPDHPAFTVMDEDHELWRDELEEISPVFREPEREAWRRLSFRRTCTTQGDAFDAFAWFEGGGADRPGTVEDWCFLLGAMVRQCPPGLSRIDHLQKLRIVARITSGMTQPVLAEIRARDPDLYRTASWAIWQGIACGHRFAERFQVHNGAGGMVHAVKSGFQRAFDRFFTVWPIGTDDLLQPIAIEAAPWWNRWLMWMAEHRPEEFAAFRDAGRAPPPA